MKTITRISNYGFKFSFRFPSRQTWVIGGYWCIYIFYVIGKSILVCLIFKCKERGMVWHMSNGETCYQGIHVGRRGSAPRTKRFHLFYLFPPLYLTIPYLIKSERYSSIPSACVFKFYWRKKFVNWYIETKETFFEVA